MSNFKSQISLLVATEIGKLEGALRVRLNTEIDNQINKFLNQCPPPDVLQSIGIVVNSVNGVLNLFESRITKFRALAKKLDSPINTATISINILKKLPTMFPWMSRFTTSPCLRHQLRLVPFGD